MPQQINLLDASLKGRREPFRSSDAAFAIVAVVGLAVAAAVGLQQATAHDIEATLALERQLTTLQTASAAVSGPAAPSRGAAELQRLRQFEASQRQVRAALDSGTAGRTQGYAEYFLALSRQARPALWITGFGVAADGVALELQGRMTDPRQLPGYLHQLNGEPLFKGREFAQLSLKALDAGTASSGTGSTTEFALRADLSPASVGPK